jgi:hypothetical protein
MRIALGRSDHNLEASGGFFYFFRYNRLKSPDSTKEIQIKPSVFPWISLVLFGFSLHRTRVLVVLGSLAPVGHLAA